MLEEKKLILYDEVAINLATDVMALPGNIHAVNVAFEYEEYHFLGMSVWARKGRYFLFVNRIRRLHPTDEQWRALIGGLPTSKFRKPFWYQVSMWPVILGSFIVYNVVRRFVRQTAQKKLNMLKRDRHYQLARETYFRNEEGDETLVTKPDERRFTSAKSVLVGQGVQPNKVDANLQLLIGSELKENNHRITQEFQSGEALEAKEKWEDCVELYSKLAKLIPLDDARHPRAAGLLEVARRKLAERQSASPINAANATNKDDEAVGT